MKMIIVTGMSGAGKSTALNVLEDEGYLRVNRTAGLNTIYLTDLAVNILDKYYSEV